MSQKRLKRELDIKKFVQKQRMMTRAMLALLESKQIKFISKMSQLVLPNTDEIISASSMESLSGTDSGQ